MRILTRYLIRSHAAPFLFALSILTGLIFLNTVAQRIERLAGRGLEWSVIGEFLMLSLPHTVALTFPMAVLVAVLYTFSQLTAMNEVTAMAAGGVKPSRMLLPLVAVGAVLAIVMLFFNDRVLPESNHRLKNLMVDISRKSPTFQLREQVVNEIETGDGRTKLFLQATRIDPATQELEDVVIYDVSDPGQHRTIRADNGIMAFNGARTDLYLTLYDGVMYEVADDRLGGFQRLVFEKQIMPLRGVSDIFERQSGEAGRTDREMNVAMLSQRAEEKAVELRDVRVESRDRAVYVVRQALGLPEVEDSTAAEAPPTVAGVAPGRDVEASTSGDAPPVAGPTTTRAPAPSALTVSVQDLQELPSDALTQGIVMNQRTNASRAELIRMQVARYRVEIHKKFSIAFACIVFVLVGAPLAVRFPRGGVGMVIAVSVGIFAVYWMGLIGGEKLADKGMLHPFWAMWTVNLVFLVLGAVLSARMGREVTTTRGGGWDDLWYTLHSALSTPFRRRRGGAPTP